MLASQSSTSPAGRPTSTENNFTIQFEPPSEFFAKSERGAFKMTEVEVGFFDGVDLVRTVRIPRELARINGGTVSIQVPRVSVANQRQSSVTIRVRMLGGGPPGQWSASAGSIDLPVISRRGSALASRAGSQARESTRGGGRQLTVDEVRGRTALMAALTPLLGAMPLEEAVGSFSRARDLAAAVVISRKHDLPFAQLCRAVRSSPKHSLAEALASLRPSFDIAPELRSISSEAKRLADGRPRRQPVQ